jgi:hypothetical protein
MNECKKEENFIERVTLKDTGELFSFKKKKVKKIKREDIFDKKAMQPLFLCDVLTDKYKEIERLTKENEALKKENAIARQVIKNLHEATDIYINSISEIIKK